MRAYHFTSNVLRDGSPLPPIGKKLIYSGNIKICTRGYHASLHPFDALIYAPGTNIHLVEVGGKIIQQSDKLVAQERTILKSFDASELLFNFACDCALEVIHLWDAPQQVKDFLLTRDKKQAARAAEAAWAAAWAARAARAAEAAWAARAARAAEAARAARAAEAARAAAWAARADKHKLQREKFKVAVDAIFSQMENRNV